MPALDHALPPAPPLLRNQVKVLRFRHCFGLQMTVKPAEAEKEMHCVIYLIKFGCRSLRPK